MDTKSEPLAFKAENLGPKHSEFRNRNKRWLKSLIQFDLFGPDGELVRETVRFNWQDETASNLMSHMIVEEEVLPAGSYELTVEVHHWKSTQFIEREEFSEILVDIVTYRDVDFRQK
jgi:hypothetical protein